VVENKIKSLGATVNLRTNHDGGTYLTDNGNPILDCSFGIIKDPATLSRTLGSIPGVVEQGLFIGLATMALIGKDGSVQEIKA
jgi:ribose 5-phosphate isomerase A